MERYNLEKKIPSSIVDKALIAQIEKYLNDRLSMKMKGILSLKADSKINYQIRFKDSLGEEHLASISEFHRDKFPNDIKEIILDYSVDYTSVDIRLRFSKEFSFSYLNIDIRCEGAKEVALGISNEINEIIKENKSIHFIFYHNYAWYMYLLWLLSTNAWSWTKFPYSNQLWFFCFFSGLAYFGLRQISPYTSFDTKNKEKQSKFTSWLLNGLAGVFVFGVIAMYFREHML